VLLVAKFRKLEKHSLNVQLKNSPYTKIFFRELVRERVFFLGMGITVGALFDFAICIVLGRPTPDMGVAFVLPTLLGVVMTVMNRGANPYGDLR
jgi:hypothetical protein